jgi:hypothetical protein
MTGGPPRIGLDDLFSAIRSFADSHVGHEKQLRSAFVQLADRITESLPGADVHVVSDNAVLEEYGDDEYTYGFLSYCGGEIVVAYTTKEDALFDSMQYPGEPSYSIRKIRDCPFKWLLAVAHERVIASFVKAIIAKLGTQHREAEAALQTLANVLNAPIRDAAAALEVAAGQMGYQDVARDWRDAQASVFTDPREAITRSSSLIETVCKHILDTKSIPLPSNEDIQHLLRATLGHLALAPGAKASKDLQQMASGVVPVVQGIGAFRTHVGTAHGRGPRSNQPNLIQARFAVTMAGAVSTFLIEVLDSMKTTSKDAS